jgi:GNAT superfamily N-acetyltransferase
MKQNRISLRKATISDARQFAYIKAEAYADDRLKSKPSQDNIPEWYDGEWYIGLGIFNENEAIRIIDIYDSYLIMLDDIEIGVLWLRSEAENSLSIEDFCILPIYQGNGYGTKALYILECIYEDIHVWVLSTPIFCVRNRHLYEKIGYKQVGKCSKDTVILYEKRINRGEVN